MAKTIVRVESDLGDLVTDLLRTAESFPELILEAANAQMEVIESATKTNWTSMVPWGTVGDYVYDSIGYNTDYGTNDSDIVGMVGVFHIDRVRAAHGYDQPLVVSRGRNQGLQRQRPTAPQLAYWAEFGFLDFNGVYKTGIPFSANAFYSTKELQDSIFMSVLSKGIDKVNNNG